MDVESLGRPRARSVSDKPRAVSPHRQLRRTCQEQLALHIESRTGYAISSRKVRLSPSSLEPYKWRLLQPEVAWIFSKPLWAHTSAACRELLNQIGKGFEACIRDDNAGATEVPPCSTSMPLEMKADHLQTSLTSALETIEDLQEKQRQAEAVISQQSKLVFQYNIAFDQIAQILEECRSHFQIYSE